MFTVLYWPIYSLFFSVGQGVGRAYTAGRSGLRSWPPVAWCLPRLPRWLPEGMFLFIAGSVIYTLIVSFVWAAGVSLLMKRWLHLRWPWWPTYILGYAIAVVRGLVECLLVCAGVHVAFHFRRWLPRLRLVAIIVFASVMLGYDDPHAFVTLGILSLLPLSGLWRP